MAVESEKRRRDEYSEATRRALLAAARRLFSEQGYQATGIEAVAQATRVTRGALYHHFDDKRALFDAVVMELQAECAAMVQARARTVSGRWERLSAGIDAYLDACLDPAYRRLAIQESPVVLGLARHREIDEAYPLGLFIAALNGLRRDGEIDFADTDLLSRMLAAMINEVALLLPDADDPRRLRDHAQEVMVRALGAFRRPVSPATLSRA